MTKSFSLSAFFQVPENTHFLKNTCRSYQDNHNLKAKNNRTDNLKADSITFEAF
jgi:hypothetical protein